MKMGIKEFRERISEIAFGDERVVLTHHGKRLGQFIPDPKPKVISHQELSNWVQKMADESKAWRASTPNWQEIAREGGIPDDEIAEMEAEDRCS